MNAETKQIVRNLIYNHKAIVYAQQQLREALEKQKIQKNHLSAHLLSSPDECTTIGESALFVYENGTYMIQIDHYADDDDFVTISPFGLSAINLDE